MGGATLSVTPLSTGKPSVGPTSILWLPSVSAVTGRGDHQPLGPGPMSCSTSAGASSRLVGTLTRLQQAHIFRMHHVSPLSPTRTQATRRDFCRSGPEPAATYTQPLPHRVGQQTITPQFITLAELYELLARSMVGSTRSGINHFSHKLRGMACYEITPDTNLMKM